jgi:hypothetical protein
MTVQDIAILACTDCGDTGSTMQQFAMSHVRRKYQILYDAHPWLEAMAEPPYETPTINPILTPYNTAQTYYLPIILPLPFDKVMWMKGSTDGGLSFPYEFKPRNRGWIEKNDGSAFLTTTSPQLPRYYYPARSVGFPTLSPQPGKLTLTPLSSAASSFQVIVEGIDTTGLEQAETFSISGLTPITTNYAYAEVHNISKSIGTVPLQVTDQGNDTTIVMQPNDESMRYTVVLLWPAYNGNATGLPLRVRIGCKLKIDLIPNPQSVPRISGLYDALYYFTRAAIHGRQKQRDMEKDDMETATALYGKCVESEQSSQGSFQQIVPKVYDDPGDVWNWGTPWGM